MSKFFTLLGILIACLTVVNAQSTMYGTYLDVNNEWVLVEIDQNTGTPTIIGPTGNIGNPVLIAADDNANVLYGVSPLGQVYTVNTSTGQVSQISTINITAPVPLSDPISVGDVAFNNADGKLYAVIQRTVGFLNTKVELITIDPATGNATIVVDINVIGVTQVVITNGGVYVNSSSMSLSYPVDLNTGLLGAPISHQDFLVAYASEPNTLGNNAFVIRADLMVNQDLIEIDPATGQTINVIGPVNNGVLAGRQIASITVLNPVSPTPVPTIGEWGLIILGLSLSVFGVVYLRRLA